MAISSGSIFIDESVVDNIVDGGTVLDVTVDGNFSSVDSGFINEIFIVRIDKDAKLDSVVVVVVVNTIVYVKVVLLLTVDELIDESFEAGFTIKGSEEGFEECFPDLFGGVEG
ncbi:hypothetical protein NDU88_009828 [Pleurodeles waltl]|uniref:Uncharacterized protein n=1 Tax=Pleurodeles waltl TaxID=8319 RepID=A0AAV7PWE1_PLEWA|nr:hypothetical protein NDU88_009828 [Pleurodeles waltl]